LDKFGVSRYVLPIPITFLEELTMKTLFASLAALALLPVAAATEVNVSFSEDFTEDLADDYGVREGERLTQDVIEDLEAAFKKSGVAPARIDVTIEDAKPNRPTIEQVRQKPGLDMFRSISLGGMDLSGIAFDAEGNVIGEVSYDWYEFDLRNVIGSSTWTDANRASRRFAKKMAKQVSGS
jgi:hypothetical protein